MYLLQTTTQINSWTVIASILGSSVISAFITYISSRNLKGTEFKYNFRKYIVDKRIKAYEEMEPVIAEIQEALGFFKLKKPETREQGERLLREDMKKIGNVLGANNTWYSPTFIVAADAVVKEYIELIIHGGRQPQFELELKLYDRWSLAVKNFRSVYFEDIVSLSNVDGFIKSKKEENIKYLLRLAETDAKNEND